MGNTNLEMNCKFLISTEKYAYYPDEEIKGTVIISTKIEIDILKINISFHKLNTLTNQIKEISSILIDLDSVLHTNQSSILKTLKPGTYNFPFTLKVDKEEEPSIYINDKLSICHYLSAKVYADNIYKECTKYILIKSICYDPMLSIENAELEKQFSIKGTIIKMKIPRNTFTFNDNFNAEVFIDNKVGFSDIEKIKISFKRRITGLGLEAIHKFFYFCKQKTNTEMKYVINIKLNSKDFASKITNKKKLLEIYPFLNENKYYLIPSFNYKDYRCTYSMKFSFYFKKLVFSKRPRTIFPIILNHRIVETRNVLDTKKNVNEGVDGSNHIDNNIISTDIIKDSNIIESHIDNIKEDGIKNLHEDINNKSLRKNNSFSCKYEKDKQIKSLFDKYNFESNENIKKKRENSFDKKNFNNI